MQQLIATDTQAVHFSIMTGKLNGLRAINTNTATNAFCKKMFSSGKENVICTGCYSMAQLNGSRKNCQPAFERNSELFSERLLEPHEIPWTNDAILRFHGHGELINLTHLDNFLRIAEYNPQTVFALWTKRKDFIAKRADKIPDNLILIYSNPLTDKLIKQPPKHFHKVFNNVTKETEGENCTGQKCIDCRKCYSLIDETVIIERQKKRS
jgi:hypothetical protein